jgi:hypothetical protein
MCEQRKREEKLHQEEIEAAIAAHEKAQAQQAKEFQEYQILREKFEK